METKSAEDFARLAVEEWWSIGRELYVLAFGERADPKTKLAKIISNQMEAYATQEVKAAFIRGYARGEQDGRDAKQIDLDLENDPAVDVPIIKDPNAKPDTNPR